MAGEEFSLPLLDSQMTSFREMIRKDIDEIFLNPEEFADYHDINGQRVKCVMDTDVTRQFGRDGTERRLGVMNNQIRIFIKISDMVPAPVQDQLLVVDGSHHRVDSVSVEDGVLVVLATAVNE